MDTGSGDRKQAPSLPANHAFVVQFRAQAAREPQSWAGRVEHLVSGQATHFESWEDLQQFVARVLHSLPEKPP